jgi:hypothetical protein
MVLHTINIKASSAMFGSVKFGTALVKNITFMVSPENVMIATKRI